MKSLYSEIKSHIGTHSLQKKKTTNDLLHMSKTEFKDILILYIYICKVLKGQGISNIKTQLLEIDEKGNYKNIDFIERDFNYLILSKGNNIINDIILISVIRKCAEMTEKYIMSKLIKKNPSIEYFTQFQLGNFEGMEYVFNQKVFNTDILFSYESGDETIEFETKSEYNKLKIQDLKDICLSLNTSDKVRSMLFRLSSGNFAKYKKYTLYAAEEVHKGNDLEEDGSFMLELTNIIKEQDEDLK